MELSYTHKHAHKDRHRDTSLQFHNTNHRKWPSHLPSCTSHTLPVISLCWVYLQNSSHFYSLSRSCKALSVKSQIINSGGSLGQSVSVATTQLRCCSAKAAVEIREQMSRQQVGSGCSLLMAAVGVTPLTGLLCSGWLFTNSFSTLQSKTFQKHE